ncbi:metallophosphoesterase [Formosa algae]|uniref:MPP superfamily phosphohydrolase n=1 Tax=Formosa algae TaxID=225843 RepID=A0A9X0YHK9_9FLAO|nr:metallophosphoesterase [Formosa algae]MBP1838391.1 putative MPP superfamily phosphohydrolase [Formosa algae]MDQ0334526.1 putative MPP superfamily phosphohydrolase [Formosa algae]OEI79073.1 phosphoesterase [Formosa algae]
MIRWILFFLVYALLDWYSFQAFKSITKQRYVYRLYWVLSALVLGNFVYQLLLNPSHLKVLTHAKSYAFGFLLVVIVPKLILLVVLGFEDLLRFPQGVYRYFTKDKQEFGYFPERRAFISKLAIGMAAIPFAGLLYGMFKGKYDFRVLKYTMNFEDLPEAFDGYRITQISDIHSGSFDNREKIEYAIDLINEQQSDTILFTGDMVNNLAEEMIPWKTTFSKLQAKDGKFSVLGNHDYGDYVQWNSEAEKDQNLEDLKAIQKEIGFDLILNDSRYLEKDGQRIALIGVENWGRGHFKKAGDLKQAVSKIDAHDFKILMSHDPSHWEDQVIHDDYHYHLTLSGHTHGMQFGIEIPGWVKWSPIKWRYKYWAGIYKEMGQYINVNRGFGFLGFPGRVGIWPEITVIELKKGSETA